VVAARLAEKWRAILAQEDQTVIYASRPEKSPHKLFMLFDESAVPTNSGSVFSMCCVVLDDPDGVRAQLKALLKRYLADPFASGRKDTLKRKGFHYTDDAEEIRTDLVKLMTELPLRAFVAYGVRPEGAAYQDAYTSLFSRLARDRFFAADRRRVELVYEENPQVKHSSLNEAIEQLYASMYRLGARRPASQPTLRRASKLAEPLLALPDYFLGVFGAFALSEIRPEKRDLATKRFERLRDRFRLIMALNHDVWYSRHHPFAPWPGGDPRAVSEPQEQLRKGVHGV